MEERAVLPLRHRCVSAPLAARRQLPTLQPEQVARDVLLVLSLSKQREAYGVSEVVTALLRP